MFSTRGVSLFWLYYLSYVIEETLALVCHLLIIPVLNLLLCLVVCLLCVLL